MDDRSTPPGVDVDSLLDRLAYMEQRVAAKAAKWEVEAYRGAIEKLHGEALRRLIDALRRNPALDVLLQEAARDEVVYTVLRQHEIITPSLEARVQKALRKVRPALATHGGDIEVTAIEPPRLLVRLIGACDGCSARHLSLRSLVARALKLDCPEITELVEVTSRGDAAETPVRLQDEGWRPAGMFNEIPAEGARDLVVDREQVLLVRRGDEVKCFAAYCPHRGVAIDSRDIEADGLLTCERHGFRFDLATGDCLSAPGLCLESYEVANAGDRLIVRMHHAR